MSAGPRYAVYWTPARSHPLWIAGCEWLGRDAESDVDSTPVHAATATPRRYGFHATLKAPMRLRPGSDAAMLRDAVARVARSTAPFEMPPLQVATLGTFVALRPARDPVGRHPLRVLADRCVVELDGLRAPVAAADLATRRRGLDDEAAERLARHGYEHVLEGWRFHMTLTDPFDAPAAAGRAVERAARHFQAALAAPLMADELAIFVEPEANGTFVLTERIPLSA